MENRFPMLPRARLVAIVPRVKAMFATLGLQYTETSIVECMYANVQSLLTK